MMAKNSGRPQIVLNCGLHNSPWIVHKCRLCMAKLSMAHGFTKGVSVDVSYLWINYILEDNLPYVQSRCWYIQSNMSKLHLRNNSYMESRSNRKSYQSFEQFFVRKFVTKNFQTPTNLVTLVMYPDN